jgi:excisionase family DNA binding protein
MTKVKERMEVSDYGTLLEQLEAEMLEWSLDDCTNLISILERVRVRAWARIVGGTAKSQLGQDSGQLLTLPQVAERLAVPETYAYELARQNRLPVIRLGKYVRVPVEAFERWLSQQASLEQRIDNNPPAFHSGAGRNRRANHGHSRIPSRVEPKSRVGVRPHIAPEAEGAEEKAGE